MTIITDDDKYVHCDNFIWNKHRADLTVKSAFWDLCKNGDIDAIQNIVNNAHPFIVENIKTRIFKEFCYNGHLEHAKWSLKLFGMYYNKNIPLYETPEFKLIDKDRLFARIIEHGQVEVADWILTMYPDIDVHWENDYGFVIACEDKRIDVLEYLLSLEPKYGQFNIHADDEYCILCSYENQNVEMIRFLKKLTKTHGEFIIKPEVLDIINKM